jgi:DNA-binding transcriptional LysR family regulator
MDISWDEVKLFLAVAEEGSVSGAARKLRMAQPTLSRRLARHHPGLRVEVLATIAEAGVGAIVLPRLRHRFSRPSGLVPLDIPRIRLLAQLIETELGRVVRRRGGRRRVAEA